LAGGLMGGSRGDNIAAQKKRRGKRKKRRESNKVSHHR